MIPADLDYDAPETFLRMAYFTPDPDAVPLGRVWRRAALGKQVRADRVELTGHFPVMIVEFSYRGQVLGGIVVATRAQLAAVLCRAGWWSDGRETAGGFYRELAMALDDAMAGEEYARAVASGAEDELPPWDD